MSSVNGEQSSRPLRIAKKYSKGSLLRLAAMQAALEQLDRQDVEGDVVECGVWMGGHIILARMISPRRLCWLYDTFEGMPPPGPHDRHRDGRPARESFDMRTRAGKKWARATKDQVRQNMIAEGVFDITRLRFVEGDVVVTLQNAANVPEKIALLRLDTDWYESTKAELEVLFPKLAVGGILIVDDYGHWMGARKATVEYFAAHGWNAKTLKQIDYSAVMMVKEK